MIRVLLAKSAVSVDHSNTERIGRIKFVTLWMI